MMMNTMNALIWNGSDYPDGLSIGAFPVPELKPGWVKVRIKAVGICGSDLHLLTGHTKYLVPRQNFPVVLGHENAGVVVETGEGVVGFTVGDRVAIEPLHACTEYQGSCPACRCGQYHLCEAGLNYVGLPLKETIPGGYGDFCVAHHTKVYHIPDNISFEEAAILDTLAVEVHAIRVGQPEFMDTVVVYGCGIVGLEMIQVLRSKGVRTIIAVAKYEYQAQLAQKLGASRCILISSASDTVREVFGVTRDGADQVYECVGGLTDAVQQSIAMCRRGGTVMMLGGASRPQPIDLQAMLSREIRLLPVKAYSTWNGIREFQISINLLSEGIINHTSLITHRFNLDDWRAALDTALNKQLGKVVKVMFIRK